MTKRLFIFAGYDPQGIVDDTLIYYLTELSKLGDIVFTMDSECAAQEIKKLDVVPNILHANIARHGEYDFGSYKRGFLWARENNILKNYDWVYLVNDSVIGPVFDVQPVLSDLESRNADLTGMISYGDKMAAEHVQSWFIGLSKQIATTDWLADFMHSIQKENNKEAIICKYEFGLSRLIISHGFQMNTLARNNNEADDIVHMVYHQPLQVLGLGIPFIKKTIAQNIINNSYLLQYVSASQDIIAMSRAYLERLGRKAPDVWQPVFRLRLFGLQLIKIYRQKAIFGGLHERKYRVQLFGCIPIMFLHFSK